MGVFTEQVQRLATEQEILRKERQEKRELKKKQEEAERNLYYKLENAFACKSFVSNGIVKNFDSKKDAYMFLSKFKIKNLMISKISKNIDIQYYLDKKYSTILKKIYLPYKEQEKEEEKEIKEKEKIKLEEEKAPTTFDVVLSLIKCILFIIFIPILFFVMLFYYLLK